jgi:AraC family transcriptional regulator
LARIQRISCESGEVDDFSVLDVGVETGDRWSGIRVQTMLCTGEGDLPESILPGHVLTIGASHRLNAHWSDGTTLDSTENRADTVCIFPALQPYRATWDSTARSIFVELSPSLVDEASRQGGADAGTELRPGLAVGDHFIPPLAHALVDLAAREEPATRLLAEMLGLTLATHVGRTYGASVQSPLKQHGPLSAIKMRRLEDFIDAHLDAPLSLTDLANQMDMSLFHFARCFRASTGASPHQYVTRRRIERAQAMLKNPELSVADVAQRCGFSQQSHFGETFRRLLGSTPKQYRAALGVQPSAAARTR